VRMKIEYIALGGEYTSKAYVSWLNEGYTARGVNKYSDYPVYVRWQAYRKQWVEDNPVRIMKEYILARMGHCEDCAISSWNGPTDGDEPQCDCAYRTVEGLFDEIEEEEG